MSITHLQRLECDCGAQIGIRVIDSLNAGRHPHLRQALLDRKLHMFWCERCGRQFNIEKELFYFDLDRRQFLGAFPLSELPNATACARQFMESWQRWMIDSAPVGLRELAQSFLVRVCFGYEELREKIVADEAGLSDLALEALKIEMLRAAPYLKNDHVATFRLDRVTATSLVLVPDRLGRPGGTLAPLEVPRTDYDVIAARGRGLLTLRPGLASGPHCSLLRLAYAKDAA